MKVAYTKCCYCRRYFNSEKEPLNQTKEHFIPKSRGGINSENILPCCKECNVWKADKMPELWLKIVQAKERVKYWQKQFKGKLISDYKY